ncbi:MAG: endopeptidase La [Clostridia bacterium]|nr:endopeptidase La [Clostridia bacterium]
MENNFLPVLSLRSLVLFPDMPLYFDVTRKKSVEAVRYASKNGLPLLIFTQKDLRIENPSIDDLYKVGIKAHIRQIISDPEKPNHLHLAVKGMERVRLVSIEEHGEFNLAKYNKFHDKFSKEENYLIALSRQTKVLFDRYLDVSPQMPPDIPATVLSTEDPQELCDYLASILPISTELKMEILSTTDVAERIKKLNEILARETQIRKLEVEIVADAEDQLTENQREYFLREQLKVIYGELGNDDIEQEVEKYKEQILAIENIDENSRTSLLNECTRLLKYGSALTADSNVTRAYLQTVLSLPFDKFSKDETSISKAKKILDKDHYGLETVKERILEYIAVKILNKDITGQIICLVGPPGVGKTSIAKSLAQAMNKKYQRIALGGISDEAQLRGHRKTYIGSMPGRIIKAISRAETKNPLILLDEVDKLGNDYKGDPYSALLEILDPEQNKTFVDNYVEIPFDLSQVMFVTTANDTSPIPAPLLDRMEIIELSSYTEEEKMNIGMKFLKPKSIKNAGLDGKRLTISNGAMAKIISDYTKEAGVRGLEKQLSKICRKAAKEIVSGNKKKIAITEKNLSDYLGIPKFVDDNKNVAEVGKVNGLAWTSVGGSMLSVESALMIGKGELKITGSLGDVMKESAAIAVGYIRSKANLFGIDPQFSKNNDIHIHVPEGATPKDGPSAGVTLATSLLSTLLNKKVPSDVAMTGEITLLGNVLPIGGLKEKSFAAYKNGIKRVFIPKENLRDLPEIPNEVKENIEFIPVEKIGEIFKILFFEKIKSLKIQNPISSKVY